MACRDRALNGCPELVGVPISETADFIIPNITTSTLFLSNGSLVLFFSEIIDITPQSYVNLSKISLVNESGVAGNRVNVAGATILSLDGTKMELLLSEVQRIRAIELSAQTPGEDNSGLALDVSAGAIRDRAQNLNADTLVSR